MDLTGVLVSLGSFVSMIVAAAAFAFLAASGGGAGASTVEVFGTLAFLVASGFAAVAWGRRLAPVASETPYW